jgi:hypothetical protein
MDAPFSTGEEGVLVQNLKTLAFYGFNHLDHGHVKISASLPSTQTMIRVNDCETQIGI